MRSEPAGGVPGWPDGLLFKPDLFSRPVPAPAVAPPAWQVEHVEPLMRHYAGTTGRLVRAELFGALPSRGLPANGVTCRLVCAAGVFVLKIVMNRDVLADIHRQIATMRAVSAASRLCPDALATDDGAPVVELADGNCAYLMTCLAGHSFAASVSETVSAGRQLPVFLDAARNISAAIRPQRRRNPYFIDVEEAGLLRLRAERARWPAIFGGEIAALMTHGWSDFERELARLRPFGERLNAQPPDFGHIDLHPHNLISRDGALAGVVDLDACFIAPAPLFPAFALLKLLKQLFVRARAGEISLAQAEEAAASFRSDIYAYAARFGITPQELADTAKLEAVRRFLSVCRFGMDGREIPWNGPLVHFAAIAEADRLFC